MTFLFEFVCAQNKAICVHVCVVLLMCNADVSKEFSCCRGKLPWFSKDSLVKSLSAPRGAATLIMFA